MNCSNCNNRLDSKDLFCGQCGQKVSRGRQKAADFIKDGWNEFVKFDKRFFRTLIALFIPGKLTLEVNSGRRARYIKPIRLYIGFSIIAITLLNILVDHREDYFDLDFEGHQKLDMNAQIAIDSQLVAIKEQIDWISDTELKEIQTLTLEKLEIEKKDSMRYFLFKNKGTNRFNMVNEPVFFANADILNLTKPELFEKYSISNWFDIKLLKQQFRLQDQESNYLNFIIQKIGICILIMLPFLALFLKLIYIRNDFYYSEHLVFSLNTHSFFFMLTSIFLTAYIMISDQVEFRNIFLGGLIVFVVYLFLSLKLVYQQGTLKTIVKFLIINLAYFYLAAFFLAVLALISFLFF